MCTCINLKTKDFYFGRNLDLEYRFGEKVVVTPRKYEILLKNKEKFKTKYAMIGMASVIDNYPLYADASNEKGLSIAGLYFPGNACYGESKKGKINITPFELIPWCVGNFSSVKELRKELKNINLVNISFADNIPLADLHWMISDKNDSIVLEPMENELKIYDNPIGVLTNNPPFSFHLTNINNYINLTTDIANNRFSNKISLKTYGQGMGAIGLPGDNSPASRFIRTSFNRLNSVCDFDEESSVSQFFHILDSVSMIKGTIVTEEKKYDITTYSCCINTTKGIYYYKTYNNNQITAIKMTEKNINSSKLDVYDLIEKQQINYMN